MFSEAEKTDNRNGALSVFINIILCFLITFIALVLLAFVITYTSFPTGLISPAVIIITVLSVILAGILTSRKCTSKGWLYGTVTGFLYMLILYLLGAIVYRDTSFGLNSLSMFALGIFSGTLGGIIGINLK